MAKNKTAGNTKLQDYLLTLSKVDAAMKLIALARKAQVDIWLLPKQPRCQPATGNAYFSVRNIDKLTGPFEIILTQSEFNTIKAHLTQQNIKFNNYNASPQPCDSSWILDDNYRPSGFAI